MLTHIICAALFLFAPAAPSPTQATLPVVSYLVTDSGWVISACVDSMVVPISPIRREDIGGPAHKYRTPVVIDKNGRTSWVETDCAAYPNLKECAKQHKKAVEAFEVEYPHVVVKD